MKRRAFLHTLAVTPAIAVPAVADAAQTQTPGPAGAPTPQPPPPPAQVPALETTPPGAVADAVPGFFSESQLAALRKLSDLLMPGSGETPGALDAGTPEFLDFYIGASPRDRQQLYREGLDRLNVQASNRFDKAFADVDAAQAGELLAPLREPWTFTPPDDPVAHFLRQAKQDIRTATTNSEAMAMTGAQGGRRPGGVGQYWLPID